MSELVIVLLLALAGSAVVGPLSRWALSALTPSRAVKVTVFTALSAALGTGLAMSSLAVAYLAGWAPIAGQGHLSVPALRRSVSVPAWLGLPLTGVLVALLAGAVVRSVAIGRTLYRAERLCRELPGRRGPAFVEGTDIFVVAGLIGRIVIGRSLYDGLSPDDRRVVLAHERSHLRGRHHLYVHAVDMAAAANPLLRGVRDVVRLGIERWADEDAAETVADRQVAARALARVALRRNELCRSPAETAPAFSLAVGARQVGPRVQALLAPRVVGRGGRTAVLVGFFAVLLLLAVAGFAHVDNAIEAAQTALFSR